MYVNIFNGSAPGANTAITGSSFTPRHAGEARIQIAVTTSTVVNWVATDGTTEHKWGLNSSVALNAGDTYYFTRFVSPRTGTGSAVTTAAMTYHVEFETDSVIEELIVHVIPTGQIS